MKKELNRFSGRLESSTGKVKPHLRLGLPEKTLTKLKDLHEMLQCDPDEHGYVVTTFKEIQELTEMDLVIVSLMIQNNMIQKAYTGGSPKFKYKWDTIKPTMDMAVGLLEKRIEQNQKDKPEGVVSESQPESILPDPEEIPIEETTAKNDRSIILDSSVEDGIMTAHVNLDKLGITEAAVLNAILAIEK